jgi:hypothetical protein
MIVKSYHIMDYGDFTKTLRNCFHPNHGAHYIVLPHRTLSPEEWHNLVHKGTEHHNPPDHARILVAATFAPWQDPEMLNTAQSVSHLLHPLLEPNVTLHAAHVDELHHLFCGSEHLHDEFPTDESKKVAASKANIRELVRRAASRHPAFRLTVF